DYLHLRESLGPAPAMDAMRKGIDLAAAHIAEERAVAFGEIGRPHFPVDAEIMAACNELLGYAMARAKELDCAVVLHTEDPTRETFAGLARIAANARLDPKRVVKHHSTPLTRTEDTHGLVHSILAQEDPVVEALKGQPRFLLARVRLRLAVPIDARFDERLVSFEHRLDGAVVHVADVSVEPEFFRFVRTVRPEVDALNAPPEDDDRAGSHSQTKSMGHERTL